jgi:hypothetical protein
MKGATGSGHHSVVGGHVRAIFRNVMGILLVGVEDAMAPDCSIREAG